MTLVSERMTKSLSRSLHLGFLFVCMAPVSAFAQDPPKVGLVMGVPAAVSVIWHATEKIAIRPEITFNKTSSESPSGSESSSTSETPGVSALFYTAKWDSVRAYFSPRYTYQHGSATSGSNDSQVDAHTIAGSAGVEFAAHRRFSAFGELGLVYSHGTSESGSTPGPSVNAWGVRTAVGVILYF